MQSPAEQPVKPLGEALLLIGIGHSEDEPPECRIAIPSEEIAGVPVETHVVSVSRNVQISSSFRASRIPLFDIVILLPWMPPATPSRRSPIRTHINGRPRRRSASGGYALLPARSSGFRHSRARLQEALGRRTHLGGGPHRPLAPVGQPRHAGPGQPRPRPLRASRTGRTRPGTASSSRPRAARHPDRCRRRGRQPASTASRTRYRSCPTPSTSPARQVWVAHSATTTAVPPSSSS